MTNTINQRLLLALLWMGASAAASAQSSPRLETLYTFTKRADGGGPNTSVSVGKGGVLYGTTGFGGMYDAGVVFSLTPPQSSGGSWTEAVLSNFNGNGVNGEAPSGPLIVGTNGVLYGATRGSINYNGNNGFDGTLYSLAPASAPGNSWKRTVLCTFNWAEGPSYITTGGGVLYGATYLGGANLNGVVFSLAPPASHGDPWSENVLYNLPSASTSNFPQTVVIGSGGVIYSATESSSSNQGSVFSLTPPASGDDWSAATLYDFATTADGINPNSLAIGSGGVLFGTTTLGGSSAVCTGLQSGCGVVFALTAPASPNGAWRETVLHTFDNSPDGAYPNPLLVGPGGVLYGSTYGGGTAGYGTLFSLTPPTSPDGSWTYELLYSFTGSDGGAPNALVFGPDGFLYGTTYGVVGFPNNGTVFAFRP